MQRTLLVGILASTATVAQAQELKRDRVEGDRLGVVTFSGGATRIPEDAADEVGRIAEWHAEHPDSILFIDGWATGASRSRNLRLSEQRTDAVRTALIDDGADPARMVVIARDSDPEGNARRASGRVVIRASRDYVELAREQRDPNVGEDARARGAALDRRAAGGDVPSAAGAGGVPSAAGGGTTVVIVPGGATSGAASPSGSGVPPEADTAFDEDTASGTAAGGAWRTSGGTGASAQTGLGMDPTDNEDRARTSPDDFATGGGGG